MPFLLQVGSSTAVEIHEDVGHMACTLGGVNVEARAGVGCVVGDAARGARHELFVHRAHLVVSDQAARRALGYAERCVGRPFVLDQVPDADRGGDSSGLLCGVVCRAIGRDLGRLFTTATWPEAAARLGFRKGLGGGGIIGGQVSDIGRPDRPFPGHAIEVGAPASRHVRWAQARLNFAADGRHAELEGRALVENGEYDGATATAVRAFQRGTGGQDDGRLTRATWAALNALR
ncbi:MAG: peptidoglycan-binding domain-containing protein [Actinomycetales bacterium]